ncbi:hypothetical protein BHE97_16910 [Aeromicrobium sp. PE09-221]|uniref:SCO6745 family protein n=1 Tax=Aeromicrobium sp. PE09-221 TaxID=1898043 RepID=UPI000B3EC308|nr:hypothetical protein [Aeromicrobium sp. PE09-221]OUZ07487.1 hypothetical protein BHE97_16910 [Aeromicrobium sp. PE09-221]
MAVVPEFWQSVETLHAPVYFAEGATERYAEIGLAGFWMGYTASRSAALGTPSPELVTALFHGFSPARIRRALPDAWSRSVPAEILRTRRSIAHDALAPLLGADDTIEPVARQLTAMLDGADWAGKPLAAAHAALPVPEDPLDRLWHAATVWREYRGDCHVAVLTAAGLGGAAANRLTQAAGLVPPTQQAARGWDDDAWSEGAENLRQRGWLTPEGALTDSGRAARIQLERATDRVCANGLDHQATARALTVTAAISELAKRVSPLVPELSPTGVRPPTG